MITISDGYPENPTIDSINMRKKTINARAYLATKYSKLKFQCIANGNKFWKAANMHLMKKITNYPIFTVDAYLNQLNWLLKPVCY